MSNGNSEASRIHSAKRCKHGDQFDTFNYHAWFVTHFKKNKKVQWVGHRKSLLTSKVSHDPQVRAANWLCDSARYNNWDLAELTHGWLELPLNPDGISGPSKTDWREAWADELAAHPEFAWTLIHVGPEGLYRAANLSAGEMEVMRLKQEGHTQEQVAFLTGKTLGTTQKMLSRGYAKVARLAGVERPIRRRVNSRHLPIEDPFRLAA